jgi:hypothetical protein
MSTLQRQAGDWISIHAHGEREPLRLTVSIALGELPYGWTKSRGSGSHPWRGVAGLVLIAPFVLLLVATLVSQLTGIAGPYQLFATSPVAILAATVSLFIGLPIAFVLNAWPITRLGLRRQGGWFEGLLALEVAPLQLVVVILTLLVGGFFVGHLAVDSYACVRGVHSAC